MQDKESTATLLKIPEAAVLLNVARSKAYELAQRGDIPTVRLGPRAIRVPRAALERWIDQHVRGGD